MMRSLVVILMVCGDAFAAESPLRLVVGEGVQLHFGPFSQLSPNTTLRTSRTCANPQVVVDDTGACYIDMHLNAGSDSGDFEISIMQPAVDGKFDHRGEVTLVQYHVDTIPGIPTDYAVKYPSIDSSLASVQNVAKWEWVLPRALINQPTQSAPSWPWETLGFSTSVVANQPNHGPFTLAFQPKVPIGGRGYIDTRLTLSMAPSCDLVTQSRVAISRRSTCDINNALVSLWKRRSIQMIAGADLSTDTEICTFSKPATVIQSAVLGARSADVTCTVQIVSGMLSIHGDAVKKHSTVASSVYSAVDVVHVVVDMVVGAEAIKIVVPIILVGE